jgi:hypothetical protein
MLIGIAVWDFKELESNLWQNFVSIVLKIINN